MRSLDMSSSLRTSVDRFGLNIDVFFVGVGLVGGLATLIERARGKSSPIWGPGRWSWALVALYVILKLLASTVYPSAAHIWRWWRNGGSLYEDLRESILSVFIYRRILLPDFSWFLLALGLTSLAAPARRDLSPDAREWAGRVFAALLILTLLGLTALPLLGYQQSVAFG
jgi:hypothetical protein